MGVPQTQYYTIYFAPDVDSWWNVNPGMLLDIADLVPTNKRSYKSYQSSASQNVNNGAFSEATYGTALTGKILKRVDGTARMFAATPTRLLENTAAAWVDVSLGGTNYTTATDWNFAAFGNDVLAVSKANNTQISSTVAGVFANLGGGSPKASCITVQKNFVIVADTDDGTNNLGDNIMWSALGNDKSWTADAATQAGNVRILDAPGKITALVNMRDAVAVYKEDSLHLLEYQGSPLLWTSRLISDKVGCASSKGVVAVNGVHYFLHRTGLHRFDGASVVNVGNPVNGYVFTRMGSQANFATVQGAYDEYEGLLFFYFHDADATDGGAATNERRYALAHQYETGLMGFVKHAWNATTGTCRCVLQATLSDITAWKSSEATSVSNVLTLGNVSGTGVVTRRPVFGQSTGSSVSLGTGNIGDGFNNTVLNEIRLRLDAADFATGASVYPGPVTYTANAARNGFDGMTTAKFFTITIPLTGCGEINGLYLTTTTAGTK